MMSIYFTVKNIISALHHFSSDAVVFIHTKDCLRCNNGLLPNLAEGVRLYFSFQLSGTVFCILQSNIAENNKIQNIIIKRV